MSEVEERRRQARGAQLAFAVQVAGVAVSYALQIVLARSLGPSCFGAYSFVLAWTGPLAMLAGLGLPTAAMRFLPVYRSSGDRARLAGLVRASERIAFGASVGIAAVGSVPVLLLLAQPTPLLVGLWTLPFAVQLRIQSELARSAGRFKLAFVVPLLQQLVMLGAAVGAAHLSPARALLLPALGAVVVLPWQRLRFRRGIRRQLGPVPPAGPTYETRQWLSAGAAFLAIEASQTVLNQADALLVGGLGGSKQLALFSAAASTGSFAMFAMVAVGAATVPSFAPLWHRQDRRSLNELAQRAVRWAFWPQLASTVLLVAIAEPLLGLFGHGFASARLALIFLFAGQLANTATGFIGSLMVTTDNQKRTAHSIWLAALLNVVLVSAGIHVAGVTGAAAGTALSSLGWNLWLYRLVRRHVGVYPSIVDAMLHRPVAA
jgi:O-antigen/teichoic acid export membrane protein